jgi:type IV pilus assembly protein PilB
MGESNQKQKPKDILLDGALAEQKKAQASNPPSSPKPVTSVSVVKKEPRSLMSRFGFGKNKSKPKKDEPKILEKEKLPKNVLSDKEIQDILLSGSYVTKEDLSQAKENAEKFHTEVIEQLIGSKKITKDLMGQAIAEHFKVPYADLNTKAPSKDQVLKIPQDIAKQYQVVLFDEKEDQVTVTTDNPKQENLVSAIQGTFKNKKININYSLSEDIKQIFISYRSSLETRFEGIIKAQERVAPEIVEEILSDALAYRSSDIHFEPQKKEVVIRFRVDGVLREAGRIEKKHYENMLNRIKVQAKMRIDEHMETQDGAIRFNISGNTFDVRVSIAPTMEGEKVVMRLLAQYVQSFGMADLGLSATNQEMFEKASKKPFGMILVTGPTGSGKSTTLYATLKSLNRPEVNITTIEDPVEYRLVGVNQIQVNEQKKITFAKGLRSIVRQDPDIILVGEIRDNETAEIAINAALTGHLLLSTFHSNDAATTIPRLLDMGVEPFLMSSTMELIIAQRLVRKVHDNCKHSQTIARADLIKEYPQVASYFSEETVQLYKGKGCKTCKNTGYLGRTAIFEFILMTSELKDLVLTNPSTKQINELARSQGTRSLFEDGIDKVKNGVTTLEELLRVASPPEKKIEKQT